VHFDVVRTALAAVGARGVVTPLTRVSKSLFAR
jgi:hypothetical protein